MDKNKNQKSPRKKVKSIKIAGEKNIKSDVQGSYTGVPEEPYERPIQDVDDL